MRVSTWVSAAAALIGVPLVLLSADAASAGSGTPPPVFTEEVRNVIDTTTAEDRARARLWTEIERAGGATPSSLGKKATRTASGPPARKYLCDFWFSRDYKDQVIYPTKFDAARLATKAQDGDEISYECRYLDNGELKERGRFAYQHEAMPEVPPSMRDQADALLTTVVEQWFPLPTATGRPRLTNQRVGIESYIGIPELVPPPPVGDARLSLRATAGPARFSVPVRDGPTGVETWECTDPGLDAHGVPNGDCNHPFDYATDGLVQATLTITYHVYFSSDVTGETDAYLGSIDRTSTVDMAVRDIQATFG